MTTTTAPNTTNRARLPGPWNEPGYLVEPPAVLAARGKAVELIVQLEGALDELAAVVGANMPPAKGPGFNALQASYMIEAARAGAWQAEQLRAALG